MPDIFQDLPIKATPERVFGVLSSPAGLDAWWTKKSAGQPLIGSEYELWFGPEYDWRAKVTRSVPGVEFELEFTRADPDWTGTRVGFHLEASGDSTTVRFHHTGWPQLNEHYRVSCHCWAMYLRILRRYIEHGEMVPYEQRLDV
ncbi:MAG: SRPBCC domain-containing protein [Gemmatimonadetes bacterium]|nr:SRPBCC domain-containing protein [Gemmatimonadota bacterium]